MQADMSTALPPTDLVDESRRRFIRQFSLGTAASIIGGRLWTGRVLADVTPGATNVGSIKIKLSDYPALANDYGSVQFKFNNAIGTYYPFTVTRAPGDVFHAVDTHCNHENCVVSPYDENNGNMTCSCHGSQFSINGALLQGPATASLACYYTAYNSSTEVVTVEIPGLLTKINTVSIQSTTATTIRLRLQFPSLNNTFIYRVMYQQTLTDAPVFVMFSNTAAGAAIQNQVAGNGLVRSVYVDASGTTGFFSIALIVSPYT
jgi:Rieske Fe-S protein